MKALFIIFVLVILLVYLAKQYAKLDSTGKLAKIALSTKDDVLEATLFIAVIFIALFSAIALNWIGVLILAVWIALAIYKTIKKKQKMRTQSLLERGLCPACEYDLRGSDDRCRECGRPCLWQVIIQDDDVHSFEFVIDAITQIVGSDKEIANQQTNLIHQKGDCIVSTGGRVKGVELCKAFQSGGLKSAIALESKVVERFAPDPIAVAEAMKLIAEASQKSAATA